MDLNVIFGKYDTELPKLYLCVAMIFPDPLSLLECSVRQVLVFPASLSSPVVYRLVHTEVLWYMDMHG